MYSVVDRASRARSPNSVIDDVAEKEAFFRARNSKSGELASSSRLKHTAFRSVTHMSFAFERQRAANPLGPLVVGTVFFLMVRSHAAITEMHSLPSNFSACTLVLVYHHRVIADRIREFQHFVKPASMSICLDQCCCGVISLAHVQDPQSS